MKVFQIIFMKCLFLLIGHSIWAQTCTSTRYIDDLFMVTTQSEPAIFATVDAIVYPPYVSEGITQTEELSFDLYEPSGDLLEKRPLIIMAFGGAFLAGSKTQGELVDYCESMARKGFVVAAIDYRIGFNLLDNDSAIRAVYRGAQDFRAAVRYFRQNAALYNIDTNHIFGGGNSAGSISAIHAAYVTDADRTTTSLFGSTFFQNNTFAPNWQDLGCLDCSGNTFTTSGIPNLLVNLWGAIGDVSWINAGDVPIISFHGDADLIVDINCGPPFSVPLFPSLCGSNPIHTQTNTAGIDNELHVFAGTGHEVWGDANDADFIVEESADFMYQYMRSSTSAPTILGPNQACQEEISTYSISNPDPNSTYCWSISNDGTIISDNNNTIQVQWDNDGISTTVSVNERNCLDITTDVTDLIVNVECLLLPVELFAFNAKLANKNDVSLSWISALEEELEYYSIEYSLDGENFEEIGIMDAKNTDASFYHYNFLHEELDPGKHYYRLRMVHFDGKEIHSATIAVEIETGATIAVYPNPTSNFLNISLPTSTQMATVQLVNSQGQIIKTLQGHDKDLTINVQDLAKGFYTLVVENKSDRMIEKVLIK